jgi:Rieske Fe-S protein
MKKCETCGNEYDKAFEVVKAGKSHTFDSFECAITALAPVCEHCGCKILGHGVEARGLFYCCAHCARESGVEGVDDRV